MHQAIQNLGREEIVIKRFHRDPSWS